MRQATHQLTKDPVMLKILDELKRQNKTGEDLEQAIGVGNGAVSRWKYVNKKTYMNHIDKIASFLNVTTEYLQSIPEKEVEIDNLTETEKKMILEFRRMEAEERRSLIDTIAIYTNSSEWRRRIECNTNTNESKNGKNPLS